MFLVYLSRMVCAPDAVEEILAVARARNATRGLTGLLLNDRRHFLQFLEGPRGALADLLIGLAADTRHADLRVLTCRPLSVRLFSGWDMASRPLEDGRSTLAGFAASLETLEADARCDRLQRFALERLGPGPGADIPTGAGCLR